MKPFDFINAINYTKEDLIGKSDNPELAEKLYTPYVVNKGLSYFPDTVLLCNELNMRPQTENKLQFDFFLNSIRKRKRFSKWYKKEQSDSLDTIVEYYGYSYEKANQVLPLFTENELKKLKQKLFTGGVDGC
jgi:hypothetical protein